MICPKGTILIFAYGQGLEPAAGAGMYLEYYVSYLVLTYITYLWLCTSLVCLFSQ